MNVIRAIHPYKHQGLWVFDDESVGLDKEPFISGADEVIEVMTAGIAEAAAGFTLLFSDRAFPGHQAVFERRRAEFEGWWYYSAELDKEGWLCPALFKYFEAAPENIYAQFKPKAV